MYISRGIIANNCRVKLNESEFGIAMSVTPEELRYYILYWNRVVIPISNLIHLAIPDEDAAVDSGAVERPIVYFTGSIKKEEVGLSFAIAQAKVAGELLKKQDIDWTIHQVGSDLRLPQEFIKDTRKLRFGLINLLPSPTRDVKIEDILNFKSKRKEQLSRLHHTFEKAYLEVIKSPDPELAERHAIIELKESLQEVESVFKERWKTNNRFSLTSEINLESKNLISGLSAGAAFDFFTNLYTIPVGTITGLAVSTIKLKASYSSTFMPAIGNDKLSYLSEAYKSKLIK